MTGFASPKSLRTAAAVVATLALAAGPVLAADAPSLGLHWQMAQLPNPRWDFPALWTGSRILVFGGGSTAAPDAESILLYDVASDSFVATHSRLYPLSGPQSAVWIGGAAYVFTTDPQGHAATVRYDPVADKLTTMSGALPLYSSTPGLLTAVTDGRYAYVFGGESTGPNDRIFRYDPVADTVTVLQSAIPGGNREMAAAYAGGAIYLFGGAGGAGTAILKFDPSNDTVTTLAATLPMALRDAGIVSDGQTILLFGGDASSIGYGPRTDVLRFDTSTQGVTVMGDKLPVPLAYAPAVWTGSRACMIGGRSGSDQQSIQSGVLCTAPLHLVPLVAAQSASSVFPWPDVVMPFFPRPHPTGAGDGLQPAVPVHNAAVANSCSGCQPILPGQAVPQGGLQQPTHSSASVLILAATGTVVVAGLAAYVGTAMRKGVPLAGLGLFSRILPEKSMDHPARRQIADAIAAQPGIHLQALVTEVGLARATVEHHVRVLMQTGVVHERRLGRYRCYYRGLPQRFPAPAPATMRSPYAKDVLRAVTSQPGMAVADVAAAIGSPPRVVSYHVQRLAQAGLLRLEHQGRYTRAFPTAQAMLATPAAAAAPPTPQGIEDAVQA